MSSVRSKKTQCPKAATAPNCFTLTCTGIASGIALTLDEVGHGPHLKVGESFIARNRAPGLGCAYSSRSGLVHTAVVVRITPKENRSFVVLSVPTASDVPPLLFADLRLPQGMRLKKDVAALNIWSGIVTTDVHCVRKSREAALLEFTAPDQTALAFFPDGSVSVVVRVENALRLIPLSPVHAAQARVQHAIRQISECNDANNDFRRKDAVHYGMVDLLVLSQKYESAREVIIEFLYTQTLSRGATLACKEVLRKQNDVRQFSFACTANDVPKAVASPSSYVKSTGASLTARAKKAARIARDVAERLAMRGKSGQSTQKHHK